VIIVVGGVFLKQSKIKVTPTPTPSSSAASATGEKVREITVLGNEYSFSPSSLSLVKGEKVRLTFTNTGSQFHNLVINELGIKTKTVAGGKSDTIEFTSLESGVFNFFCGIGDHQSLGMEGKLHVE